MAGFDFKNVLRQAQDDRVIQFEYTNHRGETAIRTIEPTEIYFGSNEYYPEKQWLLRGYDLNKDNFRTFALTKMKFA